MSAIGAKQRVDCSFEHEHNLAPNSDGMSQQLAPKTAPVYPYSSTWEVANEAGPTAPDSVGQKFHDVLDATSWVDPVVAPTVNSLLYLNEGNWQEALWSAPVVGPVLGGITKKAVRPLLKKAKATPKKAELSTSWLDHPSIYGLSSREVTGALEKILHQEADHQRPVIALWSVIAKYASVIEDNHFVGKDIFITQHTDKLTGHLISPLLGIAKTFEVPANKAVEFAEAIIGVARSAGSTSKKARGADYWLHVPDAWKTDH